MRRHIIAQAMAESIEDPLFPVDVFGGFEDYITRETGGMPQQHSAEESPPKRARLGSSSSYELQKPQQSPAETELHEPQQSPAETEPKTHGSDIFITCLLLLCISALSSTNCSCPCTPQSGSALK